MEFTRQTLNWLILIIAIIIATIAIATGFSDIFWNTQFWSGEDSWICEQGKWIKHGKPDSPMPIKPCKKI